MGEVTLKLTPNPTVPNTSYKVAGVGYVPGELLGVQMTHSEMTWSPRRRDAKVAPDGSFSLDSNSHVAGSVEVIVLRPSETEKTRRDRPVLEPIATAMLTVEEAEDDEAGGAANPSGTPEDDE